MYHRGSAPRNGSSQLILAIDGLWHSPTLVADSCSHHGSGEGREVVLRSMPHRTECSSLPPKAMYSCVGTHREAMYGLPRGNKPLAELLYGVGAVTLTVYAAMLGTNVDFTGTLTAYGFVESLARRAKTWKCLVPSVRYPYYREARWTFRSQRATLTRICTLIHGDSVC